MFLCFVRIKSIYLSIDVLTSKLIMLTYVLALFTRLNDLYGVVCVQNERSNPPRRDVI